jgi:DNA-binding XRE family transcriptional regulator
MPRRAAPSDNVLARIRTWFGLRQDQLALYLEVSPAVVQAVEAGRRSMSHAVAKAMLPLAQLLPGSPDLIQAPLPAELPPGEAAPDVNELDFRRRVCLQRAAKLRAQAAQLAARAHYARRWAAALPALLPLTDDPDPDYAAARRGWLQRHARPLTTEEVTRWRLLQAQALALETEAAALAS